MLLLCVSLFYCKPKAEQPKSITDLEFQDLTNPIPANVSGPNIINTSLNSFIISWTRKFNDSAALEYCKFDKNAWTAPSTIAKGTDWFVNWADFPALMQNDHQHVLASFLPKSDTSTYAYDIHTRFSNDNGISWSPPTKLHDDSTKTEHGFVSMTTLDNDYFALGWLDGRNTNHDHSNNTKPMTLRGAIINLEGAKIDDQLIDDSVCDCCQTSMARTSNGPVIAFRDRKEGEIRDIGISRYIDGKWTKTTCLHEDNWQIAGCPVNGPSIDAAKNLVAVAWFTGANDKSQVKLAFSRNAGKSFAPPFIVDSSLPVGRVAVKILASGYVIVVWIKTSDNDGELWASVFHPDEGNILSKKISSIAVSRISGVPKIGALNEGFVVAWTIQEATTRIKTMTGKFNWQ